MDPLLLPFIRATDESVASECLDTLLTMEATPIIRRVLRRKLGYYVSVQGSNPVNQDAEDLYQDILTRIVQTLRELRNAHSLTDIGSFQQYVARIATNSCFDVIRAKSPARARLKNNLRFLLTHHNSFAVWKIDREILCGFSVWRDTSISESAEQQMLDLTLAVSTFSARADGKNWKTLPLSKLVSDIFHWIESPVELDSLVNFVAILTGVKDHAVESLDENIDDHLATQSEQTLSATSMIEREQLLKNLWTRLGELIEEQRVVFCLGFEDNDGRDLFTLLLESRIVTLNEVATALSKTVEDTATLWSRLPMDDASIALELSTSRAQVYKWRFRALQRLRKSLLR